MRFPIDTRKKKTKWNLLLTAIWVIYANAAQFPWTEKIVRHIQRSLEFTKSWTRRDITFRSVITLVRILFTDWQSKATLLVFVPDWLISRNQGLPLIGWLTEACLLKLAVTDWSVTSCYWLIRYNSECYSLSWLHNNQPFPMFMETF